MNANDILTLLKAGYTRQEIDSMANPAPAPDPAPAPAPDPAPAPAPDPAPAPAPDPAPAPASQNNDAILAAIADLGNKFTAAMQAASLGAAMMQQPTGDTLESVMAQIIPPIAPTK